jgi:hypothetical protein|uniref:Uncharacterized protein n=1 Tax=viral metagenome TaxID=1070528 RepID=A0A6C0CZL7_9ZZZZ
MLEINPCLACKLKYPDSPNDNKQLNNITDLNNCVYETIAAFNGDTSVDQIAYNQNAVACIQNEIKRLNLDGCEFRPAPPPIWLNVPHYLPRLLASGLNPDQALQKCNEYCDNDGRNTNQCKDNCQTDRNAIIENYTHIKDEKLSTTANNIIIISAVILLIVVFLIIMLYNINKNKKIFYK